MGRFSFRYFVILFSMLQQMGVDSTGHLTSFVPVSTIKHNSF